MWYFDPKNLKAIHFELSNYCNAACPYCPRECRPEPESVLHKDTHFLDFNLIKNNFNKDITPNFIATNLCGCWGDPLTHPEFLNIIDYFVTEFPTIQIKIHTNGGLRSVNFFTKLARTLSKSKSMCGIIWGLDGLEDTNHIYRKNVKWEKVQENFRAFNSAGGISEWQFIMFPWNVHQIDEAKQRAKEENFFLFETKISFRDKEYRDQMPPEFRHVSASASKIDTSKYQAYKSRNTTFPQFNGIESTPFNHRDKQTNKRVKCNSQQDGRIFVMSDGTVWPCNEYGNPEHEWSFPEVRELEKKYNARYINSLNNFDLEHIMNNDYWDHIYSTHASADYYRNCSRSCGLLVNNDNVTIGFDQVNREIL